MARRLDYIDQAKGLLIFLVVVGHIWQSGPVHNFIYTFHMPAFFLISGILMSFTKSYQKSFKDYFIRKIMAYGPPFLIMECLGTLTDIIRNGILLNWKGYLYNTLTFHFNEPELWFLVDLFIIEILFWLIVRFLKKREYVFIAVIVLFLGSNIAGRTEIPVIDTVIASCQYLIYFTFGFYGADNLKKRNNILIVFSFIYLLVISLIFGRKTEVGFTMIDIYFLISGILGSYLSIQFGLINLPNQIKSMCSLFGRNSLIIYATHRLFYTILGKCVGVLDFGSTPILAGIIILILTMMIEYLVILAVYKRKDTL